MISYCDNKTYVERVSKYIDDPYLTKGKYKRIEREAYRVLLKISPPNFNILHIHKHQDDNNKYAELDILAQLNIETYALETTHSTTPINTYIMSSPLAIYLNKRYILYKLDRKIRSNQFQNGAKLFY